MWYAQMLGEYLRLERAFSSRSRCQCCHLFSHCVFLWRCRLRNRFQNYRPPIHTVCNTPPMSCHPIRGGKSFENVWKAFGVALYVLIDSPCLLGWDGNDTIQAAQGGIIDSCHVVIPFCLAICTICISSIGIAAGEIHIPILYSIFNGTGFCGIFFELYSFCSLITQVVERKDTLDTTQLGK